MVNLGGTEEALEVQGEGVCCYWIVDVGGSWTYMFDLAQKGVKVYVKGLSLSTRYKCLISLCVSIG